MRAFVSKSVVPCSLANKRTHPAACGIFGSFWSSAIRAIIRARLALLCPQNATASPFITVQKLCMRNGLSTSITQPESPPFFFFFLYDWKVAEGGRKKRRF